MSTLGICKYQFTLRKCQQPRLQQPWGFGCPLTLWEYSAHFFFSKVCCLLSRCSVFAFNLVPSHINFPIDREYIDAPWRTDRHPLGVTQIRLIGHDVISHLFNCALKNLLRGWFPRILLCYGLVLVRGFSNFAWEILYFSFRIFIWRNHIFDWLSAIHSCGQKTYLGEIYLMKFKWILVGISNIKIIFDSVIHVYNLLKCNLRKCQ